MTNEILKEKFEEFLDGQGMKHRTPSGQPSTIYAYRNSVQNVCKREGTDWQGLAGQISTIIQKYETGGAEEAFGAKSKHTVVNALKQFQKLVDELSSTTEQSTSKYELLGQYLANKGQEKITMIFEEIESVLGFPLPYYLRSNTAGWYGKPENSPTHKQKEIWYNYGYRVESVDLTRKTAIFIMLDSKDLIDNDFDEQDEIQEAELLESKVKNDTADRSLNYQESKVGKSIRKDPRISKTALHEAQYKCEADHSHETFDTARGVAYMEGHHLIPCTLTNAEFFKKKFDKNIDCVENIVCICPNCHRAIHFGNKETREDRLRKLYAIQGSKLAEVGIPISEDELLELYIKRRAT